MIDNYKVYVHEFPDGKVYVGLTKQDVSERWGCNGSGYKGQPVYEAILNYGWDNINHYVPYDYLSREEAIELEKELIDSFDSINNGYNKATGGGTGGKSTGIACIDGDIYTYEQLLKMSDVEGITISDISTRYNRGWSFNDIIHKPKEKRNLKYKYKDGKYTSRYLYDNFCKVENLDYKCFVSRLNQGFDIERALTQPTNVKLQPLGCRDKSKAKYFEYDGKTLCSYELLEYSNVEGLTTSILVNRICTLGWSIDDALNRPLKNYHQKFLYNGEYYTSKELADLSPWDNISHNDITSRINKEHWSVEDAVLKPKRKSTTKKC